MERANSVASRASRAIRARRIEMAEQIVARQYGLRPEQWVKHGALGREKSVRDAGYHLAYLAEAVAASDVALFGSYVDWVRTLFAGLGFDESVLARTLTLTGEVLGETLSPEQSAFVRPYIQAGLDRTRTPRSVPASFLQEGAPLVALARSYLDALLEGQRQMASRLILEAAHGGTSIQDLYLYVFQPTQREIGRLWQMNRISVAQEHYCTAATQLVMSQLYPYIFTTTRRGRRLVATSVGGELHEIGVRMVADFFEMDGWDSYYLGANMPAESILDALVERRADVLAVSATMTFHVSEVRDLIARVRGVEVVKKTTILVGGYPFLLSPGLWRQVGADGFAPDAQEAVRVANRLIDARVDG